MIMTKIKDGQLLDLSKVKNVEEVHGAKPRFAYLIGKRKYLLPKSLHIRIKKYMETPFGYPSKIRIMVTGEGKETRYCFKPLVRI